MAGPVPSHPLLAGEVIRAAAARFPKRPAAALGGRELTFGEIDARADHLARVLLGRGVRRGDRLVWWSETTIDAVPLFFACAHIGAVFTPLNPRYSDDEAATVIARAEPSLVVTGVGRGGDVPLADLHAAKAPASVAFPEVDENDTLVIFFTSGTTGEPKGCMLSHRTQLLRSNDYSRFPVGANVCMFPQFHMAGWAFTLGAWLSGDKMVYVERPDADNLREAVSRHRATTLYCIPAVWERLLEDSHSARDLASLRRADTGTSATTQELLRGIRDLVPASTTTVVYGSTEAGGVCVLPPDDLFRKPGSVGPPAAGTFCRIDDSGDLWARNPMLFSGYFRNDEATRAALVDGWYRTGELAEVDDEGYYYIVGRTKDIIRTGGETVAPVEVDLVLKSHRSVRDAAVAGIPDDTWGEVIAAFVVLKPGETLTLEALRAHCAGKLSAPKHPRRLYLVETIPRTGPTGQVQRRRLVEFATVTAPAA